MNVILTPDVTKQQVTKPRNKSNGKTV